MTAAAAGLVALAIQTVVVVGAAPLLVGVMRQVRARLEGRVGAGLTQPYRDVRKLTRKTPLTADGTLLGPVLPVILMEASTLLVGMLPLISTVPIPAVPDDLFVIVSILLLGSIAIALL